MSVSFVYAKYINGVVSVAVNMLSCVFNNCWMIMKLYGRDAGCERLWQAPLVFCVFIESMIKVAPACFIQLSTALHFLLDFKARINQTHSKTSTDTAVFNVSAQTYGSGQRFDPSLHLR